MQERIISALITGLISTGAYAYGLHIGQWRCEKADFQTTIQESGEGWRSFYEGKTDAVLALQEVLITSDYTADTYARTGLHEDDLLVNVLITEMKGQ